MPDKQASNVTMRVRVGNSEIEVSGPASFVERKIDEFLEKQPKVPTRRTPEMPHHAQEESAVGDSGKKTSVAQFFKKLGAKTDIDRTLGAAYYLEKYQNAENFTSSEVAQTIRQAKVAPPKNPSDAIAKNIKKGLMMNAGDKEGKLAFVLTSDGEEQIGEMLRG